MRFCRTASGLKPCAVIGLVILAASGCGVDSIPGGGGFGGAPLLPDTRPPSVVVLSGRVVSSALASETVDLALRNDGGPGLYYVEFYSVPADVSVPGQPTVAPEFTNSASVEVSAGYAETVRWEVAHSSEFLVLRSARVFSRARNGSFTLTGCWGC
jgi:hypothetical protein